MFFVLIFGEWAWRECGIGGGIIMSEVKVEVFVEVSGVVRGFYWFLKERFFFYFGF